MVPFWPKGMAKSQNGQAPALSAQQCQQKLCPNFSDTNYTQELSDDTLEIATLHKHRTAEMGILESPLTSQPKEGTSSWVCAARSKPFNTVVPFWPKGMAKSQNGQAPALSAQQCQQKLCPNFSDTNYTQELSVDTLEIATLHKHRTAEMGILESPLTSQPKEGTSSWVCAARSKPFNTVVPFWPKGMAKSQNGQAPALSAQQCQQKLCPNFTDTNYTQELSVDTLEIATLHKHRTAEMGILESPLTSQPTIGLSRGEWPVG